VVRPPLSQKGSDRINKMKKKTILVCGATGFIGRNMIEYYSKDSAYDVVGLYNKTPPFESQSIRWVNADLTDQAQVEKALEGVDIVIQAAAKTSGIWGTHSRPEIHVVNNAVMNSYIFDAANRLKIRHLIFFSCTIMLHSSDIPISEKDLNLNIELEPKYFGAGWTKIYLEKMCEFYSRIGNTKYTAIRHSNIFGPFDRFEPTRSHVLAATINKVMRADDSITVWGTGIESRDFLYIDDLVDLVDKVIKNQSESFSIYNCGSGIQTKISELVSSVIFESGKYLKVIYDPSKPTIQTNVHLDITKSLHQLSWFPEHTLSQGLKKTIKWWRENIENKSISQ
jgi:GDP-L-fucose synthase